MNRYAFLSAMALLVCVHSAVSQAKSPVTTLPPGAQSVVASPSSTVTTTLPKKKADTVSPLPAASSDLFSVRVRLSITPMDAQQAPEAPKDSASVSLQGKGSMVDAVDRKAHWGNEQIKTATPGAPIQIKLIGVNMVSLIQLIPFDLGSSQISVVTSGQVWVMMPDGTINYRNTVNTFNISLAERMFFFPMGYSQDGSSPLIVEIIVDRSVK